MKGFQIFFESIKEKFRSKLDVIVSTIHFMLVNEDFLCVGLGETFTDSDKSGGSELLPNKWNADSNVYVLKYRSNKSDSTPLLLKCIVAGEYFIASALPLNSCSDAVHSVNIDVDKYVTSDWNKNYSLAFVGGNVDALVAMLHKELDFVQLRETKTSQKKPSDISPKNESSNAKGKSNLLDETYHPPIPPYRPGSYYEPINPLANPFPSIGRRDLDPFAPMGGVGGGMIYDPFHPRGMPYHDPSSLIRPGSVPPRARYDPIGPFRGDRPRNPNPDHLPPPGGYDPFI